MRKIGGHEITIEKESFRVEEVIERVTRDMRKLFLNAHIRDQIPDDCYLNVDVTCLNDMGDFRFSYYKTYRMEMEELEDMEGE